MFKRCSYNFFAQRQLFLSAVALALAFSGILCSMHLQRSTFGELFVSCSCKPGAFLEKIRISLAGKVSSCVVKLWEGKSFQRVADIF